MRILAVDVGSKNLGISVCSFNKDSNWLTLSKTYCLTNPEIKDRLVIVEKELDSIITNYLVELIAYEAPYMKNGKNAMGLYFVSGIITLLAGRYNLPIIALSPSSVKKEVTGTGKAEKKLVEQRVIEFFAPNTSEKVSFDTDHASDAAAVAITAFKKYKEKT